MRSCVALPCGLSLGALTAGANGGPSGRVDRSAGRSLRMNVGYVWWGFARSDSCFDAVAAAGFLSERRKAGGCYAAGVVVVGPVVVLSPYGTVCFACCSFELAPDRLPPAFLYGFRLD